MAGKLKIEDLVSVEFGNGSVLLAVPSVHYMVEFSSVVNSIISDKDLRPGAIAVEMNHGVVCESIKWLQELGVCPAMKTSLPSGLAITMKNHLLHPDKILQVRELEKYFKCSMNKISDQELVQKTIQSTEDLIFPLCNVDSIFEAIRCSLEIKANIPVFGIDPVHCPGNYDKDVIWEDFCGDNLKKYVTRNFRHASKACDEHDGYIAYRREVVMASRLKTLLGNYNRVLFVCGIAHWHSILSLLADTSVKPAKLVSDPSEAKLERVILHPSLCTFISKYPIIGSYYEERRPHCLLNGPGIIESIPYSEILNKIFNKARTIYSKKCRENHYDQLSIRSMLSFEQLCNNTRLLNLNKILPIHDVLSICRSVFPEEFCHVLSEEFFKGNNWADPVDFPGVPVLAPDIAYDGAGERMICKYIQKADGTREFLDRYPDQANSFIGQRTVFHEYRTEKDYEYLHSEIRKKNYSLFVWPPLEVQLYLLNMAVINFAESMDIRTGVKQYNGSSHSGINIKETVRKSVSKNRIEVWVNSKKKVKISEIPDSQPVVCVFENNPVKEPNIRIYDAGVFCSDFIDKNLYKQYTPSGTNVISHISYFGDRKPGSQFDNMVADLGFGSMCINTPQSAYWLVRTKFRACPVLQNFSVSALNSFYRSKHNLVLGNDFKENLMIYALPFCHSGKLYVLAPADFKPSGYVIEQARRLNVEIKIVPLNKFPTRTIQRARERICCYSTDDHGIFFSAETERIMNQRFTSYQELLPLRLKKELEKIYRDFAFLKPSKNKNNNEYSF